MSDKNKTDALDNLVTKKEDAGSFIADYEKQERGGEEPGLTIDLLQKIVKSRESTQQ